LQNKDLKLKLIFIEKKKKYINKILNKQIKNNIFKYLIK